MYIAASIMSEINPGQTVVLEKDAEFGEVAVKQPCGAVIGYILHKQPCGCVSAFRAMQRIDDNKVLLQVAIVSGDIAVLTGQTAIFEDIRRAALRHAVNFA